MTHRSAGTKSSCLNAVRSHRLKASECHRDAGVFQAHREDSLVDLVELHQLQEVYKERQAVIHSEVLPASFFALRRPDRSKVSDVRHLYADRMRFSRRVKGTHRDYQVVFDRQLVTQRQDKTLSVLVALTNQKHAITNRNTLVNLHNTGGRGYPSTRRVKVQD